MPLKDLLLIAAPCPVSWESMKGDDRVRFCSGCSKNVFNLSDMSDLELEQFLQMNGANQCVRLFRRTDGKIMTDNCPRAFRLIRNKWRKFLHIASALVAGVCALTNGVKAQSQGAVDQTKPVDPKKPAFRWEMPKEPYPGAWAAGGPRPIRVPIDPSTENEPKPKPKTTFLPPDCQPKNPPKSDSTLQAPKNGDLSAFNMYSLAKKSESAGNMLVAHTQYIEAIQIARKQKQADSAFEKELFLSLNKLRGQMGLPALNAKSDLEMIKSLYPN
jgi:hypothetical protein